MRFARSSASALVLALLLSHVVGCSSKATSQADSPDGSPEPDATTTDSTSSSDSGADASHGDGSSTDGSVADGGGTDGGPDGGDAPGETSDAGDASDLDAAVDVPAMRRHFVALDALMKALSDLGTTTPDAVDRMAAFAATARTITDVSDVVVHPDGYDAAVKLWDGEVVSFSAGMRPDDSALDPPPPPGLRTLDYSIPKTKKAILLQMTGLGGEGPGALADLQNYLTTAGYSTTTGVPDLPTLRGLSGYAAVYINTHGQDGSIFTEQPITDSAGKAIEYDEVPEGARDPNDYAGDFTRSTERDTTIRSERLRGLLTWGVALYYNATEGKLKWASRYYVTPSWITTYWRLEPHAVVHFDACHTAESSKLADAVTDPAVGGDVFLGWVHPAPYPNCYRPSRRFWDDVLGTNIYSTIAEPQRPFDVDAVMDYMSSKSLDRATGASGPATLTKMKKSGSDSVIMVPSIEHIEMGPLDAWFTVFG